MKPDQARLLRMAAVMLSIAFSSMAMSAADDDKKASEINKAALSTGKDVAASVLGEIISKDGAKQLARGEMSAEAFKELLKSKIADHDRIKPVMMAVKTAAWWDTVLAHGFSSMDRELQGEIFKWSGQQVGEILEKEAERQYRRYVTVTVMNDILSTTDRSLLSAMGQRANGPADELVKRVNEKMSAYSGKIAWGKEGVGIYQKYAEEGWEGARNELAMKTTTALAEALFGAAGGNIITAAQWSAAAVEFLGNLVLEYANQTKTEGIIADIYGGWGGFSKYLLENPGISKQQLLEDFKKRWDSAQETIEYSGAFTGKSNDHAMLEFKVGVFKQLEAIHDSMKPKLDALLEQQRVAKRNAEEASATQFQIKTEMNKVRQRQRDVQERLSGTTSSLQRASLSGATGAAQSPATVLAQFPPSTLTLTAVVFSPQSGGILADIEKSTTLAELDLAAARGHKEVEESWNKFSTDFNKLNPQRAEDHPTYKLVTNAIATAVATCDDPKLYEKMDYSLKPDELTRLYLRNQATRNACYASASSPTDDLKKNVIAYNARWAAYVDAASAQRGAIDQAINSLVLSTRSRFGEAATQVRIRAASVAKMVATLNQTSLIERPSYHSLATIENYEAGLGRQESGEGDQYIGLPKLEFPKWGDPGLMPYVERWVSRLSSASWSSSNADAFEGMIRAAALIEGMQLRADELRTELETLKQLALKEKRFASVIPDTSNEQKAAEDTLAVYQRVKGKASGWRSRYEKLRADTGKARDYVKDDLRWLKGIAGRLKVAGELLGGSIYKVEDATARGIKTQVMFKGDHWPHNREMIYTRAEIAPFISQLATLRNELDKWDKSYNVGVVSAIEKEQARLGQLLADPNGYNIHGAKGREGNSVLFPEDFTALATEINGLANDQDLASKLAEKFNKGPLGLSSDSLLPSGFWPQLKFELNTSFITSVATGAPNGPIKAAAGTLLKAINDKVAAFNAIQAVAYEKKKKDEEAEHVRAEAERKLLAECAQKGGYILDGKCAVIAGPGGTGVGQGKATQAGTPGMPQGSAPAGGQNPSGPPQPGQQVAGGPQTGGSQQAAAPRPMPPTGGSPQSVAAGGTVPGSGTIGAPRTSGATAPSASAGAASLPSGSPAPGGGQAPATPPPSGTIGAQAMGGSQPTMGGAGTTPTSPAQKSAPTPFGDGGPGTGALQGQATATPPARQSDMAAAPRSPSLSSTSVAVPSAPTATVTATAAPPQAPKASTPAATPKVMDKDLDAQWKEMDKADGKPPIAMAVATPARPATTMGATVAAGAGAPAAATSAQGSGVAPAPNPSAPAVDATPAVRDLYQKFAEAYQRKDVRGMTKYLADQWQGPGGISAHDFEEKLGANFKSFDSIQFKMDGLQIQKVGADTFNVSYTAILSARNSKEKLDDKVSVQDVVKLTSDGPRIAKSAGSLIIKGKDPVAAGPVASAQPAPAVDPTPAIRDIYQKFAEAYQRKDARGMTKYLADQWQGMGGMAAHDFEDELATAFKTFETIQFKVDGLQIQKAAADTFNVSYAANLSVRNSKEKLDEKVNVQDVVKLTADGPRIVKTTGSLIVKSKAPAATGPAAPGQPGQAAQAADATPAIRDIYQKFADAYQRKDARGMAKYLSDQWQGPGGMSAPDFEEGLSASFKTFDSIQFKMEGLQIQKAGPDSFNVSYSASLSGKSNKQNLKVDDRVNIQDVVKITAEGPRIVKTTGSVVMKPK